MEWSPLASYHAGDRNPRSADELPSAAEGPPLIPLAAALTWQEGMGEPVTLVTFDQQLWESARQSGLLVFPDDLLAMLAAWSGGR